MKRLLLFAILCVLGLFGTLNAQDVVTIDGTVGGYEASTSNQVPIYNNYEYAITQQYYTAAEIGKSSGTIESIAFKTTETGTYPFTRTLTIYMVNTSEDNFGVGGKTTKAMADTDVVYEGEVTFAQANAWTTIELTTNFEYTGENILICINDATGEYISNSNGLGGSSYFSTFDCIYELPINGNPNDLGKAYRVLHKKRSSGAYNATTANSSCTQTKTVPFVQFAFAEGTTEEYADPSAPTNFVATAVNESKIQLTWDAAPETQGYNIYEGAELVANVEGTSYAVKNLALGQHCFTIKGANGPKESTGVDACATLVAKEVESITIGTIGDGDSQTAPITLYIQNSWVEQLYTAEELGGARKIERLAFAIKAADQYSEPFTTEEIKIYLAETTRTDYANQAWTAGSDLELVYSETGIIIGDQEWETFEFDEPFNYSGEKNLAVVVAKSSEMSAQYFWHTNTVANSVLYAETSTYPTTQGYLTTTRPVVKFSWETEGESEEPVITPAAPNVVATATQTAVTLTWEAVENATYYNIYTPSGFAENILGLEETTYTFEGLTAGTEYCFQVSAVNYSVNHFAESDATEVCVTTTEVEQGGTDEPGEIYIVEVGADKSPNAYNNYNVPVYDYNAYSVSQQIYTAADLGAVGDIHSIAFKLGNQTSAVTRQYEVYLSITELSSYGNYNFVAVTEADKVFDGDVEISGTFDSWFTINFDKEFPYSGGNIVLTVYDKSGTALGNNGYHTFYKYNTAGMNALHKKGNSPYDMSNMGTGGGFYYVNQIQLGMEVDPTPTAPQGLAATATSSSEIALTWGAVVVAESYNIYAGTELVAANVEGTSYTVEGLTPATEYCFTVTAVNELGESAASTEACATTKMLAPATPANLSVASVGEMSVSLTWDAVATAESYKVYQGENLVATNVTTTEYTVEGLASETEYCFTVSAVNNGGESAKSEQACGTTLEFTGCYVNFTLTDSYGDGWNYNTLTVSYGTASQTLTLSSGKTVTHIVPIPQNAVVTLTYTVVGSYSYPVENGFVVAYESGKEILRVDEGSLSATKTFDAFTVDCGPTVPDAPVVTAANTTSTTIVLAMEVFGAEKYNIYQGEELVASVTEKTYTVEGLEANTDYCFSVTAENSLGESEATEVCAKTKMYAPAAPANLTAETTGCFSIALTWEASATAESYNIYQGENLVASVTETTYIVEGLTHNTEYCFTVKAVNNGGESVTSESACDTTEEYDGCFVNFTLSDQWNDTWDGDYLVVSYGTVTEQLECPKQLSPKTYTLPIPQGTEVTATYTKTSNYPQEKGIVITYESGKEILNIAQGSLSATTSWEFVVDCTPEAPGIATVAAEVTGDETIVLTMSAVGAESFNIYLGEELVATTTENVYTVEGLQPETEYCFTVEAVNEVGTSEELSEAACATTYKKGTAVVQIGNGKGHFVSTSPVNEFYSYSISQTVYTAEEIGFGAGVIKSISYNQYSGNNNTRNISIFLKNVGEDVNLTSAWETLTEDLLVYDSTFTFGTTGWTEIKLQKDFEYAGGDLLVCVLDKTGAYAYNYDMFYTYITSSLRSIYAGSGQSIDPYNINVSKNSLYNNNYNTVAPQAKFVIEPAEGGEKPDPTPDPDQPEEPVAFEYQLEKIEGVYTYVYEEGTNKVTEIRKGVYNEQYGMQEVIFLTYGANGLIAKTETVWLWNDEPDYSNEWTVVNYNYTNGVLTSYTEEEWKHWYSDDEPYDVTTYTLAYNAQGKLETITDVDGNGGRVVTFSYDAEGRLVKKEKTYYFSWDNPRVDYVDYSLEYAYDANGNCISETDYAIVEGEKTAKSVKQYFYNETIAAEKAYVFAYPYEVNPAQANVLVKTVAYNANQDEYTTQTYVYNPEIAEDAILAPVGLTAEAISDTEIELSWSVVAETESFVIYNGETEVATTTETSYTVTGLTPATEYCFTVVGVNGEVESPASVEACATTLMLPPAVPVNLVATVIDYSSIVLTWDAAERAESYSVWQGDNVVNVTETTYTFEGLNPETEYCFSVDAVNNGGKSQVTETVCATTTEFTGCYITFTLNDGYGDGWNGNYLTVEYSGKSKQIEFANGATMTEIVPIPQYADVTVTYNRVGQYPEETSFVITYESGKEILSVAQGSYDNSTTTVSYEFIVDCTPKAPDAPVVTAVSTPSTITLTWNRLGDADSYNIYQNEELVASVVDTLTTYTVEGLAINTEYCYSVTAVNEVGESAASETVCATTELLAPANLYATSYSYSSISLTWDEVEEATSYNVYQSEELVVSIDTVGYTVEGLEPATEYCFTVTAVNEIGESEATEICVTTKVEIPENLYIVETGADKNPNSSGNFYVPVYDYSKYAMSQQIYTEEEMAGTVGEIYSVAFKLGNSRTAVTRKYEVYLTSTELEGFEGNNYIALSEADKVFDGDVEISGVMDSWYTIVFDKPFEYTGGNIVLTVYDKTGSGNTANYHTFYKYAASNRDLSSNGYAAYDMLNLTTGTAKGYVSQVQFGMAVDPEVRVSSETIALGDVKVGEYWTEETKSENVEIQTIATSVTSILCDNDFFTLNYDLTANPVVLNVSYDMTAEAGEKTATITVKAEDVDDVTISVTATAYTPVTPDVFELAQEITIADGLYTNTPEFANLHDDYNLPKEVNAGNTPDAVYTFTLEEETVVIVDVTGTNAVASIYSEDFSGQEGPMANNNDNGNVIFTGPTTFFFDFNDGSLEAFNLRDDDGDGYNWEILSQAILSYSWKSGPGILAPDNYIVTKEAYIITASSKLTYKVNAANYPDHYAVVVSEDGENFEIVFEEDYSSIKQATKEVDLSAYAGKGLYIGFRHYNCTNQYYVCIDDVELTDGVITSSVEPLISGVPYSAGTYYLVAAAEDQFTVTVAFEELLAPEAPVVVVNEVKPSSVMLSWDVVEYATSYNVYQDSELLANVSLRQFKVEGLSLNQEYCFTVKAVNGAGESEASEEVCVTPELLAPANLYATSYSYSLISLTWDEVEEATSYNVYQGEELVVSIDTVGYTVEGLNSETTYCYTIKAVKDGVESVASAEACATTLMVPPATPANLAVASVGELSVDLAWEASERAESYNVYQGENLVATTTETAYTITGLEPETEYCFTVIAVNNGGESSVSETVCATTEVFTGCYITFTLTDSYGDGWNNNYLTVEYNGVSQTVEFPAVLGGQNDKTITHILPIPQYADVVVTYNKVGQYPEENAFVIIYESGREILNIAQGSYDNSTTTVSYEFTVDCTPSAPLAPIMTAEVTSSTTVVLTVSMGGDADYYNVYQGSELVAEGLTTETYTVEGLTPDTEYCFTVTAVNEIGESEASEEVCVIPELFAPANLYATSYSYSSISLTWDEVEEATSYNVYQGEELVVSVDTVGYTVEGLNSETTYCYTIKTVKDGLESVASAEACATTLMTPPTTPANLAAVSIDELLVGLTWEASERAESYNVYQGENLVATTTETAYTITVLEPETEYCFTVIAVNNGGESAKSEQACVTTEVFTGCYITFTLTDSYGDSWNNNYLTVSYDEISQTVEFPAVLGGQNDKTITKILPLPQYADVTVTYEKAGGWPEENSFVITYENGNEILNIAQGTLSATTSWEFTVDCTPAVPENLVAETTGTSTIALTWDAIGNEYVTYNVYNDTVLVANVDTTIFIVEGLEPFVEYCFAVTSVNRAEESEKSEVACAKTLDLDIVAPENLVAESPSASSIVLTWPMVENAMSYNVYSVDIDTTFIETVLVDSTYTIVDLEPYKDYCYTVSAVRNEQEVFSEAVCAKTLDLVISAPENVVAEATGISTIELTWDEVEHAMSYNVYNDTVFVANVTSTSYTVEGLEVYTDYCFRVEALRNAQAFVSETACARTLDLVISAPENVLATATSTSEIVLTWDEVEHAMSYNVYNDTVLVANVTSNTYTVEGLEVYTDYCFRVEALRNAQAFVSETACAKTLDLVISAPENVVAEATGISTIELTWDEVEHAMSYNVYNDTVLVANVTSSTYTVEDLEVYSDYCFRVEALRNEQAFVSETACAKTLDLVISAPENVLATATSTSEIVLTWNEVEHAMSYNVYNDTVFVANVTSTSYTVEDLEVYSDYCFRVEALRNAQSFVSETACARTLDLVIAAPTNVLATATSISTIELTWEAVEHAMSYNVYNDTVFVANVTSTSYTVEGLEVYTDYCFRVEALRNAQAFVSETACARTLDLVIAAPENVVAEATGISTIELTWDEVEHAMNYNVYNDTVLVANVTSTSYTVEGLEVYSDYCFRVEALRNAQAFVSETACARTLDLVIAAPTNVLATATSISEIVLTWDEVEHAMSYNVYNDTVFVANVTTNTFTVEGLEVYTDYCFRVEALRNAQAFVSETACAKTLDLVISAPTNVLATATSTSEIVLTWNEVEHAMSYNVYNDTVLVANVTSTSCTVEGLEVYSDYCFRVEALRNAQSFVSETACARTLDLVIAAPTNVLATATSTSEIVLTWNEVEHAMSYNVYNDTVLVANVTTNTFTVEGLEVYTDYCFRVEALRNAQAFVSETACARTLDLVIAAPENVVAEATSTSEIVLTWDEVEHAMSYNVYNDTVFVANVTSTSYTVEGLEVYSDYCFRVEALRNAQSFISETACAKTLDLVISAPENVVAEATGISTIELTWEAVEHAMSYNVYNDTVLVANVTSTSYTVEGLEVYTDYCFRVEALRNAQAFVSETACARTLDLVIAAPTNVLATATSTSEIVLTWDEVEHAMSYNVYNDTVFVANVTSTSYTVEGLEVYSDYCFRVEALRNAQAFVSETACARTLDLVIAAPENVVAEATGISTIELTWNEVEHAMSYNIYNDTVFVANVTATTYIVEGLEVYSDYCFRVEALRNAQSFVSETACAKTLDLVISAPENVVATATSTSEIVLTWEAVENVMNYNVYQGEEMIANVTSSTYTVEGLEVYTDYCFRVEALRNAQAFVSETACAKTLDLVIAAPENVVAEATGISTIELTWDEVEHAMSYNIYNDTVFVANVTSNTFTVEGLEVYSDYCFRVEALRNAQAFVSETACAKTLDLVIAAPENVVAEATGISTIELTWDEVEHAMSYNVYNDTVLVANVTSTSYTVEGLEVYSDYCFRVEALRNAQAFVSETACAKTLDLVISAPENVVAEATSTSEIVLTWNEVEHAMSYNVYNDTVFVANVTSTSYTVEGLEVYTDYCFRVEALRNAQAFVSETACAKTLDLVIAAPENVVAEATGISTIELTWDEVEHAMSYNVYNDTVLVANVTSTSYTVEGLEVYTDYCFRVEALRNAQSFISETACAKTLDLVIAAPENVVASATSTSTIELTWEAVEHAMSYNVYQGEEMIANVTETTYTIEGLDADTEYCFSVTSVRNEQESEMVDACATTEPDGIVETEFSFSIYPNPVDNKLTIETESYIEEVTIYSLAGVMMYKEIDFNNHTIDVSELSCGVYVMKVRTENGEAVQRFIKK